MDWSLVLRSTACVSVTGNYSGVALCAPLTTAAGCGAAHSIVTATGSMAAASRTALRTKRIMVRCDPGLNSTICAGQGIASTRLTLNPSLTTKILRAVHATRIEGSRSASVDIHLQGRICASLRVGSAIVAGACDCSSNNVVHPSAKTTRPMPHTKLRMRLERGGHAITAASVPSAQKRHAARQDICLLRRSSVTPAAGRADVVSVDRSNCALRS
jgi:hypothetical protein